MKNLARTSVGTGAGTLLYTVPRDTRCEVRDITFSNTTAAPISFKLHVVASGGSPDSTNMMIPNVSVPGNTFVQWSGQATMNAQGYIQGIASAAGICVTIDGDEYRNGLGGQR